MSRPSSSTRPRAVGARRRARAEQGRLPRARGADHREDLARAGLEVDAAKDRVLAADDVQPFGPKAPFAGRRPPGHGPRGGTGIDPFTWLAVTFPVAMSMRAWSA